jgi:hypothetical protein
MSDVSALPLPELPQMANDGYITEIELQSDGGIVAQVPRYPNAAKGDYLCLYFDGTLSGTLSLPEPDAYSWPWESLVPATGESWPADGPHQVWYTVTDAAQNPSASPVASAVIDRQHTDGLPPPTFPNADDANTITYASVQENDGTHIKVPWSDAAYAAGDIVYVYWRELDSLGEPVSGSDTSVTHTVVSSDVSKGFKVLVSAPYVAALTGTGSAEAWYSVIPQTGEAQSSQTATVGIDMSGSAEYPAPVIPAGSDGWLDCAECTAGVDIVVPANSQFVTGGQVAVDWQGYDASGHPVAGTQVTLTHTLGSSDITDGFTVTVPADNITPIGIGFAQASYQVMAPSSPGYSAVTQVSVDTEHCSLLPAPEFPAAETDGVISADEVESDNGTDMTVSYSEMTVGDTVTAFWFGYLTTPETPLAETSWTETRMVTQSEVLAGVMVFHVPAEDITAVGEGYGEGRYQVMFEKGGIAASATTNVKVDINGAGGLQMVCGNGAPVFNPAWLVRPLNNVTLYGQPGADIELSLPGSASAYFYPSGDETLVVRLDDAGTGSADVCGLAAGNYTVSAWMSTEPSVSATDTMTFNAWTAGRGEIACWGSSTGGAANGTGTCRVYVQTVSTVGAKAQMELALTGSGTQAGVLPGGGLSGITQVDSTCTAAFDVEDLVAESTTFTLSLLDASSSYVTGSLTFEAPASAETKP